MAAAALSSRGVVGVRTTKGLFFIVALLSLLCVASSRIDKAQLEKLKRAFEKAQLDLNVLKTQKAYVGLSYEYLKLVGPVLEIVKQASPDFPPLGEFVECTKNFADNVKLYIDEFNEELAVEIEENEEKLKKIKKLIKSLEEHQAEF